MTVRVRLLGPLEVAADGVSRPIQGFRRRAVLAVLALQRGEIVSTDRLIDVVWGAATQPVAVNTLQSHVSYLRRMLQSRTAIVARPPGYLLDLGAGSTDVEVAEELIRQGTRSADLAHRTRQMRAALDLWRGRPLADVAGVAWLEEQAQRLDQLWLHATHTLIESRLALGEHAELVPDLEHLARDHPLDEQIQGQLIVALYRTGRQADALAAYHRLRRTLGEELGINPSQALRDLEAAVLRQDPVLQAAPARIQVHPPSAAPAPVVGGVRLGDAELVGRQGEAATLRDALESTSRGAGGAVFLIGEPGIGKTRLATETSRTAASLGLTVLCGRAAATAVQFRPLSEALLSVLRRSAPPDDPDLQPYLPALSRLVPEWRSARTATMDDSPVVLAEAILRLTIALGRGRGCVLVLEDLHDADADTLEVIDYLVDNADREPLLVIGTARSDPSAALELLRAAQRRRTAEVIELVRLGDDEVRQLAGACLDATADEVPEPVVERLLATADGVPLHVEELLAAMVDDRVLVRTELGWTVVGPASSRLPVSLATTLSERADRLGPQAALLLRVAALLGRRFPALTAGSAAGLNATALLGCLRAAVDAHLLVPEDDPQWYAFRHVLTAEALRARLLPMERTALARRAAESIESAPPSSFDGRELVTGELWQTAGEPGRAAELFGVAGRRAADHGAVSTAISLLERAMSMVDADPAGGLPAELGETLVEAYAQAGRINDAYRLGALLDHRVAPERRASARLRLARVAAAAGDWQQGLDEVAHARKFLEERPDPAVDARMDAVEAQLAFGNPTADRRTEAWRLAEQALHAAEATGQPDVACHALETLGRIARLNDLTEGDALYQRGLAVAQEHGLVSWQIKLMNQLGAHAGMRAGETGLLTEALEAANQAGALVTALDIELELSIVRICRGDLAAAGAALSRCEETAARLKLTHIRLLALGGMIIVAGQLGRRAEVDTLLDRFRELGGEDDDVSSGVHGIGLAFFHLLSEEPDLAWAELAGAASQESRRPTSYLSFVPGPHLLLAVLTGRSGWAEFAALSRSAHAQAGWNRQFLVLAEAVLHAREGRDDEAGRAMTRFLEVSQPYQLARHLGLRLVAPDAIEGGWGEPVSWLRTAEGYFHERAPQVARTCRTLLRGAGAAAPQHRQGSDALPPEARERGITVREYEVLCLIAERLSNKEIGRRLFLSPRTVEKHVANLLAKVGAADRSHLATVGACQPRRPEESG